MVLNRKWRKIKGKFTVQLSGLYQGIWKEASRKERAHDRKKKERASGILPIQILHLQERSNPKQFCE